MPWATLLIQCISEGLPCQLGMQMCSLGRDKKPPATSICEVKQPSAVLDFKHKAGSW